MLTDLRSKLFEFCHYQPNPLFKCDNKWQIIVKHHISSECHIFVLLYYLLCDWDIVHHHSLWLLTNCLTSQACDFFTRKLVSMSHIFWSHWAVFNQVSKYHALKFFLQRISHHCPKSLCLDGPFHLFLGAPFKIIMNCSDKSQPFFRMFFEVQIMQSTFTRLEFYYTILGMSFEHSIPVMTFISHMMTLFQSSG